MLQFGLRNPALDYRHRATAFGVVERDGLIACVRVERPAGAYFDLPGGAAAASGPATRTAATMEAVSGPALSARKRRACSARDCHRTARSAGPSSTGSSASTASGGAAAPKRKKKGTGLGGKIISAMASGLRSAVEFDAAHKGVRAKLAFDL